MSDLLNKIIFSVGSDFYVIVTEESPLYGSSTYQPYFFSIPTSIRTLSDLALLF
jgi:hypothetical protein